MVLPEGAPKDDPPRRRRPPSVLVIVFLILAIGVVTLGTVTGTDESEPAAVATTTTTSAAGPPSVDSEESSVAGVARGEPLAWEHIMSIDEGHPLAMLEHRGWIYLFVTEASDVFTAEEGGLRVWRSEQGTDWESLGQVIDRSHVISGVNTAGRALVAAERGDDGEGFRVWRSGDGARWNQEVVRVDGLTRNGVVFPTALGGNQRTVLVATTNEIDVQSLMRDRIYELLGVDVSTEQVHWRPSGLHTDPIEFVVWGPLGFPLLDLDGDDLGLTDREQVMVEEQLMGAPVNHVWVSYEGGEWNRAEPPASWLTSFSTLSDGMMLATGHDDAGPGLWASEDGLEWVRSPRSIERIEKWDDDLIGVSGSLPTLAMSQDGDQWERIGTLEGWPGGLRWGVSELAAGPGGLAASVYHVPNVEVHIEATDPGPVTIGDGEAGLTLDFSNGSYTLDTGGFTRTWSMGLTRPPEVSVVLPDGVIAFHRPSTGELLATFSFGDLYEAQDVFWSSRVTDLTDHRAFVFSEDGGDWVIQDVASLMGDLEIRLLGVTGTHVVATAVNPSDPFASGDSPGFEIWSARIP